jgi:hypothetical protein
VYYTNIFLNDFENFKEVEVKSEGDDKYILKGNKRFYLYPAKRKDFLSFLWFFRKDYIFLSVLFFMEMFFFNKILFVLNLFLLINGFVFKDKIFDFIDNHYESISKILNKFKKIFALIVVLTGIPALLNNNFLHLFIFTLILYFEFYFIHAFVKLYTLYKSSYFIRDDFDRFVKGFLVWEE